MIKIFNSNGNVKFNKILYPKKSLIYIKIIIRQ